MTSDLALEAKIREWASQHPKYKRFLNNMEFLTMLWLENNTPTKIKDCIVGGKARLALTIVNEGTRRPVKLCSGCMAKTCKDDCGKQDYQDYDGKSYMAGDEHGGVIRINVAPFKTDIPDLVKEQMYEVYGVIKEWKEQKEINVESIKKIEENVDISDAVKAAEDVLAIGDGKVKKDKYLQIMMPFKDKLDAVAKHMHLKETADGYIVREA